MLLLQTCFFVFFVFFLSYLKQVFNSVLLSGNIWVLQTWTRHRDRQISSPFLFNFRLTWMDKTVFALKKRRTRKSGVVSDSKLVGSQVYCYLLKLPQIRKVERYRESKSRLNLFYSIFLMVANSLGWILSIFALYHIFPFISYI